MHGHWFNFCQAALLSVAVLSLLANRKMHAHTCPIVVLRLNPGDNYYAALLGRHG